MIQSPPYIIDHDRRAAARGIELTYLQQEGDDDAITSGAAFGGDQYTGLDRFGRVIDQNWIYTDGGATVDRYQYTYDADGNVTAKNNLLDSALNLTYIYDHLDRLTQVKHGDTTIESFTLDAVGNMSVADGADRTSNSQNQLTVVGGNDLAYDNNGNTTTDAEGDTLHYDAWNRLIAVYDGDTLLAAYSYDGMGRMVTEGNGEITTVMYYSAADQIVEKTRGGNTVTENVWSPVYVNALVLRDSSSDPGGDSPTLNVRAYVTQDANYDVTSMITESDSVWSVDLRVVYDAYGNATFYVSDYTSTTTNTLYFSTLFQGMRYDAATGLYHADMRDYDPATMTWMPQDPMGYVDGMSRYGFVGDDPINGLDPLGLQDTQPTTQPATQPTTQPAAPPTTQPTTQPYSLSTTETQTFGPASNSTKYSLTLKLGADGLGQSQISVVGDDTINHITHQSSIGVSTSATIHVDGNVSLTGTVGFNDTKGPDIAIGATVYLNDFSITPQLMAGYNYQNNSYSINPSLRLDKKFSDTFSAYLIFAGTCDNGSSNKSRDLVGSIGAGASLSWELERMTIKFGPSFQLNGSNNKSKTNITIGPSLTITW